MTTCHARGSLTVGGREVTSFRCSLKEGHTAPRVCLCGCGETFAVPPHKYVLEWCDDDDLLILPDADLFDPDESFDVDVPAVAEFPCALCGAPERNVRHRRGCPMR